MRFWISLVCSALIACRFVLADESVVEQEPQWVMFELRESSFFTDRVGTAVVYFDRVVESLEDDLVLTDTCQVLGVEVLETPDSEKGASAALIRFLPLRTGIVSLPPLEFRSGEIVYRTQPRQLLAEEPQRSPKLSLSMTPEKTTVYQGEPFRIDVVWDCQMNASSLRALQLEPAIFNEPNAQVVIPRNTDPEKLQVGFPIGGRRIVAKRTINPDDAKQLGRIELPLYVRFAEPGIYSLPETRLDVSVVDKPASDFGRYAAHFNNGLFEAVDATQAYERLYAVASPMEIEVLPLPEGQQRGNFSGLFAPVDVSVSLGPREVAVGELMELEVTVTSDAPHGMLDLPELSKQAALRERFIVDDNYGRLWDAKGTRFKTRVRALTTSLQAFPALQLQVFDPESGTFTQLQTRSIPLQIKPTASGETFLSLKSFEGAAVTLTEQPTGIWHNMEAHPMTDLLNLIFSVIQRAFWPLLLVGPIVFVLLLPVARERRRRASDLRYRLRVQAYADFRKQTGDPKAKWTAFLRFMALTFDAGDKSWTQSDSKTALEGIGADSVDCDTLQAMHCAADADDFGRSGAAPRFDDLDGLAKRIAHLASKAALGFLLGLLVLPHGAEADDWSDAEQRFAEAQAMALGSDDSKGRYQEAALKFQAVAELNQRPGIAWYNSGNAWFQAGDMGRSIVAYRNAKQYRPFDSTIIENLAAARAMTLNDITQQQPWWKQLPPTWLSVGLVLVNLAFWTVFLIHIRYRNRRTLITSIVCGTVLVCTVGLMIAKSMFSQPAGAVVVDAIYAKKGPGYAYANAFNEPLHDGLEFILLQQRSDWAHVELSDGRQCWLPIRQVQFLKY